MIQPHMEALLKKLPFVCNKAWGLARSLHRGLLRCINPEPEIKTPKTEPPKASLTLAGAWDGSGWPWHGPAAVGTVSGLGFAVLNVECRAWLWGCGVWRFWLVCDFRSRQTLSMPLLAARLGRGQESREKTRKVLR